MFSSREKEERSRLTTFDGYEKLGVFLHLDPAGKGANPGRKSGIFCDLRRSKWVGNDITLIGIENGFKRLFFLGLH